MITVSVLIQIHPRYYKEQKKALVVPFHPFYGIYKCLLDFCSFLTRLRSLTQMKIYISL